MKRSSATFSFVCSVLLLSPTIHASDATTMRDSTLLLPNVRYKIAVLEFENPGAKLGLELSQVLNREIIGSMRGVRSLGVLNLRQDAEHLDLNVSTVIEIAHRQAALIVVWGEFYENGTKIYLHTHLQIVPDDKIAKSPLALSLRTDKGEIKAAPPSLLINFAPIELNTSSLKAIRESHSKSAAIHSDRSESAPEIGRLQTEDGFEVDNVEGPWMQIRTRGGQAGWVLYGTLEEQKELSELQAVVSFAQAVLQYLAGSFSIAESTISNYLDRWGEKQDKANLALAHILRGNARFKAGENDPASEDYLEAAALLPHDAAPANYLAIARLLKYASAQEYRPEMRDLEMRLIRAVQSQNNRETLDNLRVFYKCAAESKFLQRQGMNVQLYSDAISKQLASIENIASEIKQ
jgi:hypothetical protein